MNYNFENISGKQFYDLERYIKFCCLIDSEHQIIKLSPSNGECVFLNKEIFGGNSKQPHISPVIGLKYTKIKPSDYLVTFGFLMSLITKSQFKYPASGERPIPSNSCTLGNGIFELDGVCIEIEMHWYPTAYAQVMNLHLLMDLSNMKEHYLKIKKVRSEYFALNKQLPILKEKRNLLENLTSL